MQEKIDPYTSGIVEEVIGQATRIVNADRCFLLVLGKGLYIYSLFSKFPLFLLLLCPWHIWSNLLFNNFM